MRGPRPEARGSSRDGPSALDGVLVVDKPSGPTSHDLVARVRTALRLRRIGHTGTLDPLATGVLPLVVGRATRLAQFLSSASKSYDATVRLGLVTDTYDVAGRVTAEYPVPPELLDRAVIERALTPLRAATSQMPPAFSAKKIDGVRAYDLARRAVEVALDPVPVSVDGLELVAIDGEHLRLRLTVSAGFYVRTLAHDLGAVLGVGASLSALRRTRSGDFTLEQAVPLDVIERAPDRAASLIISLDALLPGLTAVRLTEDGCRRALNGAVIRQADCDGAVGPWPGDRPVRLVDSSGHLRAVARPAEAGGVLHPIVVLG